MAKHKLNPDAYWAAPDAATTQRIEDLLVVLRSRLAPLRRGFHHRAPRMAARRGCGMPRLTHYLGETCAL